MAGVDLPGKTVIYQAGQPMTALHLIVSGHVSVTFPGGRYTLGKGDVIGLTEINSEIHFLNYTSADNINMLTYPYTNSDTLLALLQKHPDVARLFLVSSFKQMNRLFSLCDASELVSSDLFSQLIQYYLKYKSICSRYRITPDLLPGFEALDTGALEQSSNVWLSNYYQGLLQTVSDNSATRINWNSAVAYGFLQKTSADFQKTYSFLEERHQHQNQLIHFYINDSSKDLFALLTTLYHRLPSDAPEQSEVYSMLEQIMSTLENLSVPDSELIKQRITSFRKTITRIETLQAQSSSQAEVAKTYSQLNNSFASIMAYAETDSETQATYQRYMLAYKTLENKNSSSEEANQLRAQLTEAFYQLYTQTAVKALQATEVLPLCVRLFLYYGFLDEELAGAQHCHTLMELLPKENNCAETGVYPFFDWLRAIYSGRKRPSRNEYEEDYADYIHKQKLSGTISEADVRNLENNPVSKVVFELRNLFPIANKMTYGRLASFCPIFKAEDIIKPMPNCKITASSIGQAINQLKAVDYSLFYREISNPDKNSSFRENIHAEFLPDIILMPNIGIRGVMWQEIEGKVRASSSRLVFSIFHLEDIFATTIHLAGDYRWEICKRIQGYRWNDIATYSLTSEYFDYVQFYKKNRSLSTEAKERIKNSLQRAKNSYKEMFIRDYIQWVLFESAGTPRLNKISRGILNKYCPFPAATRETLSQHPQYKEIMERFDTLREQKLHHLQQFRKKLMLGSVPIPTLLDTEIEFFTK